ncbi:MAG TPA: hypothetical protein VMO78_08250 [Rhizomicrobium sp.]|nr:hypothetical protein [Rhizomicrobium sp.]
MSGRSRPDVEIVAMNSATTAELMARLKLVLSASFGKSRMLGERASLARNDKVIARIPNFQSK